MKLSLRSNLAAGPGNQSPRSPFGPEAEPASAAAAPSRESCAPVARLPAFGAYGAPGVSGPRQLMLLPRGPFPGTWRGGSGLSPERRGDPRGGLDCAGSLPPREAPRVSTPGFKDPGVRGGHHTRTSNLLHVLYLSALWTSRLLATRNTCPAWNARLLRLFNIEAPLRGGLIRISADAPKIF